MSVCSESGNYRSVVRSTDGALVCARARVAMNGWGRLRGLLARPPLETGEGLWLAPCNGVHTVGMTYAIDVVFMGSEHHILAFAQAVPPLRFRRGPRGSRAVLELPAGDADRLGLTVGERMVLTRQAEAANGR